jgi:hypothetical protein
VASLIEFLEARIAEDESLAAAAIKSHAPDEVWESELGSMNLWPEDIAFWASQTPYRVLAECAAKRAIIEDWEDPEDDGVWEGYDYGCALTTDRAARALAAAYSDHPDYQQEWAA